jgi:heterodisulfide reductase subunit A
MSLTEQKIGKALVVGAGVGGIRAALDLAQSGYKVTLIEKEAHTGGILAKLDRQFPTDRCGMCKMLPTIQRDAVSQHCLRRGLFHENIEIITGASLLALEGTPGHFSARIQENPRWVDADLCTGCGLCEQVCPVEIKNPFNQNLGFCKAIHLPTPHAIPNSFVIDSTACTRCGECEKVCPTGAIRISWQDRERFRVLVVDDELIVRSSLEAWLSKEAGFSADTAGSGGEALELLGTNSYQVMFLDIKMPGMDGMEVLAKAKEISPDTAVVMMTAYATVETAVEAMKTGALDYLIKPFDAESVLPKVNSLYEALQLSTARKLDAGAVVLCGGVSYFDPSIGKDTLCYGSAKNVVTSLEFERMLSSCGPFEGKLLRPDNLKPVQKVAFIQCVGSRDIGLNADFCSSACCAFAVKEARLAVEQSNGQVEAAIFYMDMRAYQKPLESYCQEAREQYGVRFVKSRVHSVIAGQNNDCILRYPSPEDGSMQEESFDMVVLAVGQRPAKGSQELADMLELPVNEFGFIKTLPFSCCETDRPGIFVGGSFTGLKDINESLICASAAAQGASLALHGAGGGLAPVAKAIEPDPELLRAPPSVFVALCTCGNKLGRVADEKALAQKLKYQPCVKGVRAFERLCTREGYNEFAEVVKKSGANRLLVGACLPHLHESRVLELARALGVNRACVEVTDTFTPANRDEQQGEKCRFSGSSEVLSTLLGSIARLKRARPHPLPSIPVTQRALVIGGGIAGMTAALAIADHGFEVDLVEKGQKPGGNLSWIKRTIEGLETAPLLEETLGRLEKHPLITLHTQAGVLGTTGSLGCFESSVEDKDGGYTIAHGVCILATGGNEAPVEGFGYGLSESVMTQKEWEIALAQNCQEASSLESIVFIQCAGCRSENRNYCARVCCATTLKQALYIKGQNPSTAVFVLYRDMMAYGQMESYYTQARRMGVIFIPYKKDRPPSVEKKDEGLFVTAFDPILQRPLCISADRVILAAGLVPELPEDLAAGLGIQIDEHGFFKEAQFKWQPVESATSGFFACGAVLGPRNIAESIASARAAASRALAVLSKAGIAGARISASVRPSLCSLCERCIEACPYGARTLDRENEKILVNPALCQGCGSCVTACPNGASVLEGFLREQMLETIDAAFA